MSSQLQSWRWPAGFETNWPTSKPAGGCESDLNIYIQYCMYVVYKPWLIGVFHKYTILGGGRRKFVVWIKPECSTGFTETANFRQP